ncbi:MAG: RNA polymerase sigma-54 factor, partial [Opitutales bacterium]
QYQGSNIERFATVYEDEHGNWQIELNNDYIPRLRISSAYKEMLAKGVLKGKDREYLQEKFRSSKFLISSIEQRQQTIERITREILNFQLAFFESGSSRLRPLTMNQVAEKVGVHETTVSRAIANKYIRTPHGVFEMKYFFTPGYQGQDGTSLSNTSVKERIAKIIENEPPRKPLSDQKVVEILAKEGVTIARRTVAKYREELGILPTNLRRRYA